MTTPASSSSIFGCIDLKSYYASVECVDRGLDPLTTNLVVADESRSDSTICLAVSPSLKALGVPGRPRLYEVKQRLAHLKATRNLDVDYIIAMPRMARYLQVSSEIYSVYLHFFAPQDVHVYSVDEIFIDMTPYRSLYDVSPHELMTQVIQTVLRTHGITATGGIGPNLYLAKVAMDIVAKHIPADKDGVRIAELDEIKYRELLWSHQPMTDFWQIGPGISSHLARMGIHTMGELARFSLQNEEYLFQEFGVDAELLIDHAWGVETCGIRQIKEYEPETKSLASGQVLPRPYTYEEGRIVVLEMVEQIALGLVAPGLVASGVTLYVGYQKTMEGGASGFLEKPNRPPVRSSVHGTGKLAQPTAAFSKLAKAVLQLYDKLVDRSVPVRRLSIAAIRLFPSKDIPVQLGLFLENDNSEKELDLLRAEIAIHNRFGKNSLIRGLDLMDAGTTRERNNQIGGHQK